MGNPIDISDREVGFVSYRVLSEFWAGIGNNYDVELRITSRVVISRLDGISVVLDFARSLNETEFIV